MTFELTLEHLLWRMRHVHPDAEIVAAGESGAVRETFAETAVTVRRLAAELARRWNIGHGNTVAVLGFNTLEHLRLLFAVPILGAALHSLNLRLPADSLVAQALRPSPALLLVDEGVLEHRSLGPAAKAAVAELERGGVPIARMSGLSTSDPAPDSPAPDTLALSEDTHAFHFHTSGTTGAPKTYPVTHRDVLLHALSQASAEASGLRSSDRVLTLVPFCHVNGWGLPFLAALTGASLVLPGADLAPRRINRILTDERVTLAAAVPTVWFEVCHDAKETGTEAPALREVLTGGSPVPESVVELIHEVLGARTVTAWGMTETMAMSSYEREQPGARTGRFIPLMEARITDAEGIEQVSGSRGILEVRGPFVLCDQRSGTGWFDTGDIASIDATGALCLHDRHKDLIKSGGEWIVSARLEQRLCTHPSVAEAAVIARPDPKWTERPVAIVVPDTETPLDVAALRVHLAEHFPRFWLPDAFTAVDRLPRTAVGKVDKNALRRLHGGEPAQPSTGGNHD